MGDVVGAVVGFFEKDGVERFFDVLLWGLILVALWVCLKWILGRDFAVSLRGTLVPSCVSFKRLLWRILWKDFDVWEG